MGASHDEQLKRFQELSSGFFQPAVVLNAIELGLFTALGSDWLRAAEIAERIGCKPRPTEVLLGALAAFGYVQRDEDRFANTAFGQRVLVEGSSEYQGDSALMSLWFMRQMCFVGAAVRTGEAAETFEEAVRRSPELSRTLVRAMDQVSRSFLEAVVEHVPISPGGSVLDVGGASGSYGMALVEANPGARATILELPHAAEECRRMVRDRELTDRVEVRAGDFRVGPLGEGYDVVFCSNVFHLLDPDAAESLVRRSAEALRPGGRLVIKDMIGDPGGEARGLAVYSTLMLVISRGGALYDAETYGEWIGAAGLEPPRRIDCWERSSLLIATKPDR